MNTYNIYNENEPSTILYHAIGESIPAVALLAGREGIDLAGLTVELERSAVRDELGRPYQPLIKSAIVA